MRIERAKQYFAVAFMAGFIGGILFANLTVRDYVTTSGIYNPYFLKQYAQSDIQAGEYILYLCGIRLIPLALIALLGQTRVRRILSIVVFAWAGFSAGTIVCAGILNMGIQGIVFWVIAMVPQFLFYDRAVVFLYCSSVQVEFGEDFVCSSLYGGRADYGGLCESDSHADVSGYIVSCKTTA